MIQYSQVIIASELCVAPCTYVSPENSFLFVIDHVSQVCIFHNSKLF